MTSSSNRFVEGDSLRDFSRTQWALIEEATARWEVVLGPSDPWPVEAGHMYCLNSRGLIEPDSWIRPFREIDDIAILLRTGEIDGEGGRLAQAQTCVIRARGFLPPFGTRTLDFMPVYSMVHIDVADIENVTTSGRLLDLVLHDLGHPIGLVPYGWELLDLVRDARPAGSVVYHDTHFTGTGALAAFDDASGTAYAGKTVPVDNTRFQYTGHWRESVLGAELMTPLDLVHGRQPVEPDHGRSPPGPRLLDQRLEGRPIPAPEGRHLGGSVRRRPLGPPTSGSVPYRSSNPTAPARASTTPPSGKERPPCRTVLNWV